MRATLFSGLVALLASMVAIVTTPAHADTNGTVSAVSDRVLPGLCPTYLLAYDLNIPPGATGWDARITVDQPHGSFLEWIDLSNYIDASAGVRGVSLCIEDDNDRRFDLTLEGTYEDAAGGGVIAGEGSFELKRAATRTWLSVSTRSPRFNEPFRLAVKATVWGDGRYAPHWGAAVTVQIRVAGRWRDAPKLALYTGRSGEDSWRYRWNLRRPVTFRLVSPTQNGYSRSVSNTITVKTQG